MCKESKQQHYISRSLMKRWADDDHNVGVVCLYHRDSVTVRTKKLHRALNLSFPEKECEWSKTESQADRVVEGLKQALGPDLDDRKSAEAYLNNPARAELKSKTNLETLIDLTVLHYARSLAVPVQRAIEGGDASDRASSEATIVERYAEAKSFYETCGVRVVLLPAGAPVPLGAGPVFDPLDWGGDTSGPEARYMMPLTPHIVVSGDPSLPPGRACVVEENPGFARLLQWQISGTKNFPTPFLICQPSELERTEREALNFTEGGTWHWTALNHRVALFEESIREWEQLLERNRERQKALPAASRDRKTGLHKEMAVDAREFQAILDEVVMEICGCEYLDRFYPPRLEELWACSMPDIIHQRVKTKWYVERS